MFEDYEWDDSDRRVVARRIHNRYLSAYNGVPYALRFQGWCKKWGIDV